MLTGSLRRLAGIYWWKVFWSLMAIGCGIVGCVSAFSILIYGFNWPGFLTFLLTVGTCFRLIVREWNG